jgi:membrane fusion protein (multidrug efflux system)
MATTTAPRIEERTEEAGASEASEASANATGQKKRRIRVIALGVLGLGVVAIGAWYALHAGLEDTDDAQVDADVVAVPAQVAATVTAVNVVENQSVKAGDVLVQLDDRAAKAKLDQANAQLAADEAAAAAADSQMAIIEANATGQRNVAQASLQGSSVSAAATADQIAQADAQVKAATVTRDQAKTDLDRAQQLFSQNAIPRQQLDDARTRFDSAEASLTQARAQQAYVRASQAEAQSRVAEAHARVAQSSPTVVQAQIAEAHARAAAAHAKADTSRAARDLAQLDLDHTRILAPRDGIASKKTVVVGQLVAVGQPVVQIVPLSDVWVTANFKETQLSKMRVGQGADVDVDAYSGMKLHGTVQSFSGATGARFSLLPPENATGNFTKVVQRVPVRIKLDAPPQDRPLRPGMSAEVTVDTRR